MWCIYIYIWGSANALKHQNMLKTKLYQIMMFHHEKWGWTWLNPCYPNIAKPCSFSLPSVTPALWEHVAIVKPGANWTNWLRAAHWELKNGSSRETDDRILEYTRICLMRKIHMNKVRPRICEEHNLSAWLWNWQASAWIRNSTCAGHGTAQIMLRFSGCQVRNANPLVTGHTWSTLSSPPCQLPALPQRSWHGDPVMLRCLHGIHWIPLTICQECQGWGSSCCKPFVLFNDPHSSLLFYSTHPLYTVLLQGCLQMRYLGKLCVWAHCNLMQWSWKATVAVVLAVAPS